MFWLTVQSSFLYDRLVHLHLHLHSGKSIEKTGYTKDVETRVVICPYYLFLPFLCFHNNIWLTVVSFEVL